MTTAAIATKNLYKTNKILILISGCLIVGMFFLKGDFVFIKSNALANFGILLSILLFPFIIPIKNRLLYPARLPKNQLVEEEPVLNNGVWLSNYAEEIIKLDKAKVRNGRAETCYATSSKGLYPFVSIQNITVLINLVNDYSIYYALEIDGVVVPMDAPFITKLFGSMTNDLYYDEILILLLYMKAYSDDSKIDEYERSALDAIENIFSIKRNDLSSALSQIYQLYLNKVLVDNKISSNEKLGLGRLLEEFSIQDSHIDQTNLVNIEHQFKKYMAKDPLTDNDVSDFIKLTQDLNCKNSISGYVSSLHEVVFFQKCLRDGVPVCTDSPINPRGQPIHFWTQVQGYRMKKVRHVARNHIGTRIKVGKLPIYLGRSTPSISYKDETVPLGGGTLLVAADKIIISGETSNVNILFDKILDIKYYSNAIQFFYDGRYNGYWYEFNPKDHKKIRVIIEIMLDKYFDE